MSIITFPHDRVDDIDLFMGGWFRHYTSLLEDSCEDFKDRLEWSKITPSLKEARRVWKLFGEEILHDLSDIPSLPLLQTVWDNFIEAYKAKEGGNVRACLEFLFQAHAAYSVCQAADELKESAVRDKVYGNNMGLKLEMAGRVKSISAASSARASQQRKKKAAALREKERPRIETLVLETAKRLVHKISKKPLWNETGLLSMVARVSAELEHEKINPKTIKRILKEAGYRAKRTGVPKHKI